jgi:hypothetical protein
MFSPVLFGQLLTMEIVFNVETDCIGTRVNQLKGKCKSFIRMVGRAIWWGIVRISEYWPSVRRQLPTAKELEGWCLAGKATWPCSIPWYFAGVGPIFQHCLTDSLEHDYLCPSAYVFNCLFGRLISTNLAHVYEGWAIFLLDQICYAHLSMLCNKGSILLIVCFTGLFNLLAC